jgi:hypothetical protein
MSSSKRDGGPQRQPEVPVIDDPVEPAPPKAPHLPPPVPDPPDVVASWYGSDDQHYADGYERASRNEILRSSGQTPFDGAARVSVYE